MTPSTIYPEKFDSLQKFKTFLKHHSEIRTRPSKTHKKRFVVHAGDWAKYWAKQDENGFQALDGENKGDARPSIADDPEVEEDFLKGAAERAAALRAKKKGRK